ncbi:hypothetical protein SAMN05444397_102313 [Flavobacterium aquidurense]|uniref:HEAT repeat domain-containing protein n=1 Tax=Flavobacterium frigidimaris TaxID=262320 RepID=A0ABX4BRC0_FLAFR|nr:hypothetical protein [Flavobacterium frigidimaris]OXA79076.1 hypothetical protein B0A65_11040 [Flavobacterium frigidimaris]SDY81081.1 hypothetical protein SAMN05444397_102313 [Flavobacterium aquidurense]
MMKVWELYKSGTGIESFLMLSIGVFIITSFMLYLLIINSRSRNIRRNKRLAEYNKVIENVMFLVVFQDMAFSEIKKDENFDKLFKTVFFREVMIDSIINLHKNYEGSYVQKLEQFYKDSGLIKDSFRKLKSLKWEVKCKGITELAEMNCMEAFDKIIKASKARNKVLKITAINASIKLGGTKSMAYLTEHPYPIDEWTQINIINAFKKHDLGDTKGIELLLESQNSTVIALGLKLIKELKLTQKIPYVTKLIANTPNTFIKYEAQNVLEILTV